MYISDANLLKMKETKKLIKIIAGILLIPAGAYHEIFVVPDHDGLLSCRERNDINPRKQVAILPPFKTEFTFLTWNIGYSGLGKQYGFFL